MRPICQPPLSASTIFIWDVGGSLGSDDTQQPTGEHTYTASTSEQTGIMAAQKYTQFFQAHDKNNDQTLSFSELVVALKKGGYTEKDCKVRMNATSTASFNYGRPLIAVCRVTCNRHGAI